MHSYVQTENLIHFYYGFYLSFVVLKSWKRGETATVVLAQYRSIFFFIFFLSSYFTCHYSKYGFGHALQKERITKGINRFIYVRLFVRLLFVFAVMRMRCFA